MKSKEITVENMTKEEHKRLDSTANKALIVILVLFVTILGFLFHKYRADYAKFGPIGRDGKQSAPPPPTRDPASAPTRNAAPVVNMGKGVEQKQLDKMLDKGEFQEAEKKISGFLQNDDNNFMAIVQMGILQYRMGNKDESLKYLETARKINEGDLFCLQLLGNIYTITDSEKAVSFYERNLVYQIDRKDLSMGAIKAYHMAIVKSVKTEGEKTKMLQASTKLLNDCYTVNDSSVQRSLLDLLFAENAYFRGKLDVAMTYFLKVPLNRKDMGDVTEKLTAATALGIIALISSENQEIPYQYLDKALRILSESVSVRPESTIPRKEELAVVTHILFDKPQLLLKLQKIDKENKDPLLTQIKPMWDSKELRELIFSMVEKKNDHKDSAAIEDAGKILKILDKKEGFLYDVAYLQPLFRGTVLIFIGDCYRDMGNKKEALTCYNNAKKKVPVIAKIADIRIKKIK